MFIVPAFTLLLLAATSSAQTVTIYGGGDPSGVNISGVDVKLSVIGVDSAAQQTTYAEYEVITGVVTLSSSGAAPVVTTETTTYATVTLIDSPRTQIAIEAGDGTVSIETFSCSLDGKGGGTCVDNDFFGSTATMSAFPFTTVVVGGGAASPTGPSGTGPSGTGPSGSKPTNAASHYSASLALTFGAFLGGWLMLA